MSVFGVREAARGFVLAGGLSTRMGYDKATLQYKGKALVVHALERMAKVAPNPCIVGTRPDLSQYAPVVPDKHSRVGPLGGLHAALDSSDVDLNLFLPVDLPFLPAWFLGEILERARLTASAATVPLINGRPQPLVAVYRRVLLPLLDEAIRYQKFKVTNLLDRMKNFPGGADFFHVETLRGVESTWPYMWFRNINSPQDFLTLAG